MVLKDFKEVVTLLNNLIIDLRTNIYNIEDEQVRSKLTNILNSYQDKFDRLEKNDET